MALARSASGPGGLSINTSTANLFGSSNSQPPVAGGIFSSASQNPSTSQPAQTSGLFGNAAAAKPSGGLFGNNTSTSTSQPAQSGGLFGNGTNTTTSQPSTTPGSLFGGVNTSQPQQSGGMFGNTANTSQPQQPGGLFGNTAQASQPSQNGALLGPTAQSQSQTQNAGGGLFGNSTPAQQAAPGNTGGGLFGSMLGKPAVNQLPTHGGTGGIPGQSAQSRPSLFGGLSQSTSQQPSLSQTLNASQNVVPGVRIDISNVRGTTRFNDLQEDLQREIANIDNVIQGCIKQKHELEAFMPGHGEQLEAIPNDVKFIARKFGGVDSALASDAQAIQHVRELIKQDADSARLSFRAIDNLTLPAQYHTANLWTSRPSSQAAANTEADGQDLLTFFNKTASDFEDQLKKYESNLTEIETHLHGVQGGLIAQLQRAMESNGKNGAGGGTDERLAELATVLREFEESILKVAGDVGSAREGMTRLQLGEFMSNGRRDGVY